jgi:hypothetical protein
MKFEDLKILIDSNILKEDDLQFGMHYGNVPQFTKYRYSFNLDILKNYVTIDKLKEYKIRYYKSY